MRPKTNMGAAVVSICACLIALAGSLTLIAFGFSIYAIFTFPAMAVIMATIIVLPERFE